MAAVKDVLEIVGPGGEVRFVELDSARGLLNIGSHPDNDVVLDGPGVAAFHAMLDFQQPAARLMALSADAQIRVGGRSLAAGGSQEIDGYASIEIGGYVLMLLGSSAPTAAPTPDSPSPVAAIPAPESSAIPEWEPEYVPEFGRFDRLPPDVLDDFLIVNMEDREDTIDVEQSAIFDLDLVNGGDLVANFNLHVEGVDPRWVTVEPPQVNLLEGQRAHIVVTVTPPRVPTSFAGRHYIAIVVTSPTYPGRRSQVGATVTINPYYEFSVGELSPREQTVSWKRSEGVAEIPIVNRGNGLATFRVEGQDDRQELTFEFDSAVMTDEASRTTQDEFALAPDELKLERIHITPLSRRLIGFGKRRHSFTVNITPLESALTPRSVLGELRARPLLGPLMIILFGIFLCGGTFWALTPNVREFNVTVAAVGDANPEGKPPDDQTGEDVKAGRAPFAVLRPYRQDGGEKGGNKEEGQQARQLEIGAGQTLIISWDVWAPFGTINIEPGIGTVDRAAGSVQVTAEESAKYTITVNSPLRRLNQSLGTAAADVAVKVNPVFPRVVLDVEREQLFRGEPTTVWWEIEEADEVTLLTNGAPETLSEHVGSRVITPDADVTFTIVARNRYTGADGVTATKTVTVSDPPPEPVPDPVIERFDISSLNILSGEVITLEWKVTGANSIFIDPIGELPPVGTLQQQPTATTTYVLRASDTVTQLRQVTVSPAPTPTPDPRTPTIEFFTATPSTVIIGSATTLAWSVKNDGDTITNVEIKSVNFQRGGLDPVSSLDVTITDRTLFVLTAYNGSLRASATVEVVANNPVPDLSSISPDSSTDIGSGGIGLTLTGSNFIESSVVRWNGADRPTTFASGTQLNAAVSASDLITPGTASVTVHNPGPGGGDSGAKTFTLKYPAPTLSSINPTSVVKGTSVANITLTGSGFASGSKALWNGTDLGTTSFVNATQLTLTVPSAQLAAAGSISITVSNPTPGGGASSAQTFTITDTNPVPTINTSGGFSPASVNAGSGQTNLTVTGTNFVSGSIVRWNGATLTTDTSGIPTQLVATLPAANLTVAQTVTITVFNPTPGGGVSNGVTFEVKNPSATFSPSTVTAGGPAFTLTATGANGTFVTGARLIWSGQSDIVGAVDGSGKTFTATVPASYIEAAGSPLVRVENPCPTCTPPPTTDSNIIQINDPTIEITGSSTVTIGTPATLTVTLTGDQAVPRTLTVSSSNVAVGTVSPASTTIQTNAVTVPVTFTGVTPGTSTVTVKMTKADGGTVTQTMNVTVVYPAPTISNLSPNTKTTGEASFTITITGTNFINGISTASCAGTAMTLSSTTATQIQATVPTSCIATSGAKVIAVTNPGQTAANSNLTVNDPTLTISPSPITVEKNGTTSVTVSLGANQAANRTVTLTESTSGNGDITLSATSVTIFAGTSSNSVDVTGAGVGTRTLTASVTSPASLNANASVTVNAESTSTEVTNTGTNPTVFGQSAQFTAAVTTTSPSIPTGNVEFYDGDPSAGGTLITGCTSVALASGSAVCNTTGLSVGAHSIFGKYLGVTDFAASTSAGRAHTVNKADTTTSISSTADPSVFGQSVTLTVTVAAKSPGAGTPAGGTADVKEGGTTICTTGAVSGGTANCSTASLSVGAHTLKAVYAGDGNFNVTASGDQTSFDQDVNKANTTLTVTINEATDEATFKVDVTAPGAGTPTGTVTHSNLDAGLSVAPANTVSISGTATYSGVSGTTYNFQVKYDGDSSFNASNNVSKSITIN